MPTTCRAALDGAESDGTLYVARVTPRFTRCPIARMASGRTKSSCSPRPRHTERRGVPRRRAVCCGGEPHPALRRHRVAPLHSAKAGGGQRQLSGRQTPRLEIHPLRSDGLLYVPVGAPCNICEPDPARYAAIFRMKPDGTALEQYARGVRNTVGFDWHPIPASCGSPTTGATGWATTNRRTS